ncbi:hypothetical protein N7333_16815 [Pseudomonas sp. GD04158]|uniref:hypothetical protein n=1 Tax=Pseudomonas sp. GD04158 TaxID=2975439 RepID=UPI00244C3B05|nr:hypothetical protein [Pseudomonas sp. GD04158]MDH0098247.1 hypothetical protein [Pseudomonas sp. GD04158]
MKFPLFIFCSGVRCVELSIVFVVVLLVAGFCGGSAQADVHAKRLGESVYLRVPFDALHDKVVRMRVGPQSVAWSNGVFDFVGERLIPVGTSTSSWVNAYGSGINLRDTMDESPPIWVSAGEVVGGNHKVDGVSTVTAYQYKVFLDYRQVPNSFDALSGSSIILQESYQAHRGDGSPVVDVWNQYTFGNTASVGFAYKIRAKTDIEYVRFGGVQFQRIAADQAMLYVPRTPYACGLNLTNVTASLDITRDSRAETGGYNDPLTIASLESGIIKTYFVSLYDTAIRVPYEAPVVRVSSHGKVYPVAFEGALTLGEVISVTGVFGFLPL